MTTGFMVQVKLAGGNEQHYAVVAPTKEEAESFLREDAPAGATVTAGKQLSPQEIEGFKLNGRSNGSREQWN